jgi:hypothetical protein
MVLKRETFRHKEPNRKGFCTSLQYLLGTKTISHKYNGMHTRIRPTDWLGKKLGIKEVIHVSRYKRKKYAKKNGNILNRIYIPQGV